MSENGEELIAHFLIPQKVARHRPFHKGEGEMLRYRLRKANRSERQHLAAYVTRCNVGRAKVKTNIQRPYRLGLDLGTNSLGWFMVWLERDGDGWRPTGLGPGGVRVFPDGRDPQSGTSNAVDRRTARSARKRRDRFVDRRRDLMDALVRHGLMPAEAKERKALEAPIPMSCAPTR